MGSTSPARVFLALISFDPFFCSGMPDRLSRGFSLIPPPSVDRAYIRSVKHRGFVIRRISGYLPLVFFCRKFIIAHEAESSRLPGCGGSRAPR